MLKIGLIGAGRIGGVHAQSIVSAIPNARLVAVADAFKESADKLATTYNVPFTTTNHLELINRDDVDAIVIGSSTDTHAPFMIDAAKAGKHIFCEKPIAAKLDEIDAALAAVDAAGVKLQIGFNRRFDPNFARVKQAITSGEIGEPRLLHIISRDPGPPPISYIEVSGGMFFDMTIHDFDMARFLFGEVESVYARAGVMVDPAIGEAGDIDTAMIMLNFANGTIGCIDNCREAVYGYDQRAEAFGSKGAASSENMYPNTVTISGGDNVRRADLPMNFFLERYMPSYVNEMQAFVASVLEDKPVPVTGNDGRVPVVMAMAAQKSYEEGRPVRLSEID